MFKPGIIQYPAGGVTNGLLNNLVSYFKCDTSGSFPDVHGSSNGTLNGPTYTGGGKINGAYSFDGSNDYISCPTVTTGTSATFNFWLYKSSDADQAFFCENNYANASHLFFNSGANQFNYRFGGTNLISTPSNPVVNNTWNMVTVTHTGTTGKIYVNGVELVSGTVNTKSSSGISLTIGRLGQIGIYYVNGRMDEIAIYSSALSPTEIASLYNSGAGAPYSSFTS